MTCESENSLLEDKLQKQQEGIVRQFPEVGKVSRSLVQIISLKSGKRITRASSFVVEGGYLVTAWHAVKGADNIVLYPSPRDNNFATIFDGGEIIIDPDLDVAILLLPEVFEGMIPPVQLSTDSSEDRVFLVGFPVVNPKLQWPLYNRQPTIHPAYVLSRKNGELRMFSADFNWEEVDGMSGGVVVDQAGKAIGVLKSSRHFPEIHTHGIGATDISFVRW